MRISVEQTAEEVTAGDSPIALEVPEECSSDAKAIATALMILAREVRGVRVALDGIDERLHKIWCDMPGEEP